MWCWGGGGGVGDEDVCECEWGVHGFMGGKVLAVEWTLLDGDDGGGVLVQGGMVVGMLV